LKRWIGDSDLSRYIENYALSVIKLFLNPTPPPSKEKKEAKEKEENDKKNEKDTNESTKDNKNPKQKEKNVGWEENDIIRHLEFYFAICSKKHELLSE